MTDLLRYALGVPPRAPVVEYVPKGGMLEIDGQLFLTLTFTRPDAVVYIAEASGNLSEWQELGGFGDRRSARRDGTATYLP